MVVMAPPDVVEEINLLESLDFDLPCEYISRLITAGKPCGNPADWITWIGCVTEGCDLLIRNFCDSCLKHRNQGKTVTCAACGCSFPPLLTLVRAERIKGRDR